MTNTPRTRGTSAAVLRSPAPEGGARRPALLTGLLLGIGVLAISRSVLSPELLSQYAPAVAAMLIVAGSLRWIVSFRSPPGLWLLLALAGLLAFTTGLAGVTGIFITAAGMGTLWVLALYAAANLKPAERRLILAALLCLGGVQVIVAVLESLGENQLVRDAIAAPQDEGYSVRPNTILGDWTNRAQGTIGYPIPFGTLMALCGAITLFAGLIRSTPVRLVVFAAFAAGVLLSGSRSAAIALIIASGVGLIYGLRRRLSAGRLLLIAAATMAAAMFANHIAARDGFTSHDSFVHRMSVLESITALLARPLPQVVFGTGYASHERLYETGLLTAHGTMAVDNAYLTVFIQTGLCGLALLAGLLLAAFYRATPATAAMLAALTVSAFFYDLTNWHLMALLLFLVIGLALARGAPDGEPMPNPAPPRIQPRPIDQHRKRGTRHGA